MKCANNEIQFSISFLKLRRQFQNELTRVGQIGILSALVATFVLFSEMSQAQNCDLSFVRVEEISPYSSKFFLEPYFSPGQLIGNGYSRVERVYGPNGKQPFLSGLFNTDTTFIGIYGGMLRSIDARTGKIVRTYQAGPFRSDFSKFEKFGPFLLSNKKHVVFVLGNTVKIFDLNLDSYISQFEIVSRNPNEPTSNVLVSNDSSVLFWMGTAGGKQIISMKTGKAVYESQSPPAEYRQIKGHRPHIVQSPDGRYVFFINFDGVTKDFANSLLFDLGRWQMVPSSNGWFDIFRDLPDGGRLFHGVVSACFSTGKCTILQESPTSFGLTYREFNLMTGNWQKSPISNGFGSERSAVAPRTGHTNRIWRSYFSSSLGIDIRFEDVGQRRNSQGEHDLLVGYNSSLKIKNSKTDENIPLKYDQLSAMHEIRDVVMINDTTLILEAIYHIGTSYNPVAGKVLYDHFRRPDVERKLAAMYRDGQTSYFKLDLNTREVTRIEIPDYDSLAASSPAAAAKLSLIGLSPNENIFVFSNSLSEPFVSFVTK